jgi:hypothetical protein
VVFKWVLVTFGAAAVALVVLGKLLAFLNPPRSGRPRPPVLRRLDQALRWTLLVPLVIVIVLLVLALAGIP